MTVQQQISDLIHKLGNDWERANYGYSGIPRIDKDIMITDIRLLYELVSALDIKSGVKVSVQQTFEKPEPNIEKMVAEEPVNNPKQDTQEESFEDPLIIDDEKFIKEEPLVDTKSAKNWRNSIEFEVSNSEGVHGEQISEKPLSKVIPREVKPKETIIKTNQKSTSEKFQAAKTLSDVYQNNGDNSLAAKMQKNRIVDIRSAIGVNEKFLFLNKIFNGELETYNQTIEKINNCGRFDEAISLLEKMRNNSSVENEDAFEKLSHIIKRKFY